MISKFVMILFGFPVSYEKYTYAITIGVWNNKHLSTYLLTYIINSKIIKYLNK